jgi:hypothetical protein
MAGTIAGQRFETATGSGAPRELFRYRSTPVGMDRPRVPVVALLVLALTTAGCVGTPAGTPTATPLPAGSVELPDGPKEAPERPATLNRSTVREYVGAYEYRFAYNSLRINEYTDVTLDCRVDSVTERPWGYEAVVTCTGHSYTNVPANATATPGPHADWFTQSFRYRVSERATHRQQVEPREPVS